MVTPDENLQRHFIKVPGRHILSVHKPTPARLQPGDLPPAPPPTLFIGDLNYQHPYWGYYYSTGNGEELYNWGSLSDLILLFDR